ncbi:hypothetical protein GLYMA_09G098150v4 [Glycine max]|nr:hypothetical protein GLYMA_09G098150v4 [Glycine max]KAH1042316.1 hypothetical protein GYH30_024563 [Glycine max]
MLHLDVSKNHNEDFQTWLQRHIKADYGAIFAVRCWQIWKACNVEIFQDKVLSDWSIIHQVQNLHDLISQTLQNSTRPLNITQVFVELQPFLMQSSRQSFMASTWLSRMDGIMLGSQLLAS